MAGRYGLQIRAATPADAPALAELMASAGHPADPATWAARLEALRDGPGVVLLALEWGPPSGVIALTWLRRLGADRPTALVTTLLVGRDERRRGIGRLLLKAGAQAARSAGCDGLALLPSDDEPTLRLFGEASGFEEAGPLLARPLRKAGHRDEEHGRDGSARRTRPLPVPRMP